VNAERDRAVSTTLDVAVFLVLATAAVGTLAVPAADPPDAGAADPTLRTLSTVTVDIGYQLTPAEPIDGTPPGPEYDRVAHGTPADLLAEAAVESFAVDGSRPTRTHDGFRAAVRNATLAVAGSRADGVRVEAVWRPFPGAAIAGRIAAGPTPPTGIDVDASTRSVPSGLPTARSEAVAAADGGFDAVARVVAGAVIDGLFDPDATRLALAGDAPVSDLVSRRYNRTATLLGTSVDLSGFDTAAANARLRAALADRLARGMRTRFDSPRAAARAVRVGTVRIRVRTWSS